MYKVFKVEGGFMVFWVASPDTEPRPIDGAKIHTKRQAAYRKAKKLNDAVKSIDEMIKKDGAIIL